MRISRIKDEIILAKEKTRKGGVMTTEGFIPHKVHPELGIEMPVRTYPIGEDLADMKFPPRAVRSGITGTLVYALPGGESWTPEL